MPDAEQVALWEQYHAQRRAQELRTARQQNKAVGQQAARLNSHDEQETPMHSLIAGTPTVQHDEDMVLDRQAKHRAPTPDEQAIQPPDGYPLDRWSNDGDTEWPLAVDPGLRALYASIPADDPRLTLRPEDSTPFPVLERGKGRNWVRYVVEALPHTFRLERSYNPDEPGRMHMAHPLTPWPLHKARLRLAHELYADTERQRQESARLDAVRSCAVCGSSFESARYGDRYALCHLCGGVSSRLRAAFGADAFDSIDGAPRWQRVLSWVTEQSAAS